MYHVIFSIWLLLPLLISGNPEPEKPVAGVTANILFTSTDYGATWQDISAGLPADANPNSFWSNGQDHVLSTGNNLYRSRVAGPIRIWEKEPMMQQDDIIGLFPGRMAPYAASHWKGFLQYDPFLGIWLPTYRALKDKMVYTLLESSSGTLFAGCESGLYASADRGKSWKRVIDQGMVFRVREADGVLMACSRGSLFRSTDGGAQWEEVVTGARETVLIQNTHVGWVAIANNPQPGGAKFRAGLYISTDQGSNWKPMYNHLPALLGGVYDIRQVGDHLFACADAGIVRSSDGGATWQVAYLIPAGEGLAFNLAAFGDSLFAMLVARGGC